MRDKRSRLIGAYYTPGPVSAEEGHGTTAGSSDAAALRERFNLKDAEG
jgi:hypothetical protein